MWGTDYEWVLGSTYERAVKPREEKHYCMMFVPSESAEKKLIATEHYHDNEVAESIIIKTPVRRVNFTEEWWRDNGEPILDLSDVVGLTITTAMKLLTAAQKRRIALCKQDNSDGAQLLRRAMQVPVGERFYVDERDNTIVCMLTLTRSGIIKLPPIVEEQAMHGRRVELYLLSTSSMRSVNDVTLDARNLPYVSKLVLAFTAIELKIKQAKKIDEMVMCSATRPGVLKSLDINLSFSHANQVILSCCRFEDIAKFHSREGVEGLSGRIHFKAAKNTMMHIGEMGIPTNARGAGMPNVLLDFTRGAYKIKKIDGFNDVLAYGEVVAQQIYAQGVSVGLKGSLQVDELICRKLDYHRTESSVAIKKMVLHKLDSEIDFRGRELDTLIVLAKNSAACLKNAKVNRLVTSLYPIYEGVQANEMTLIGTAYSSEKVNKPGVAAGRVIDNVRYRGNQTYDAVLKKKLNQLYNGKTHQNMPSASDISGNQGKIERLITNWKLLGVGLENNEIVYVPDGMTNLDIPKSIKFNAKRVFDSGSGKSSINRISVHVNDVNIKDFLHWCCLTPSINCISIDGDLRDVLESVIMRYLGMFIRKNKTVILRGHVRWTYEFCDIVKEESEGKGALYINQLKGIDYMLGQDHPKNVIFANPEALSFMDRLSISGKNITGTRTIEEDSSRHVIIGKGDDDDIGVEIGYELSSKKLNIYVMDMSINTLRLNIGRRVDKIVFHGACNISKVVMDGTGSVDVMEINGVVDELNASCRIERIRVMPPKGNEDVGQFNIIDCKDIGAVVGCEDEFAYIQGDTTIEEVVGFEGVIIESADASIGSVICSELCTSFVFEDSAQEIMGRIKYVCTEQIDSDGIYDIETCVLMPCGKCNIKGIRAKQMMIITDSEIFLERIEAEDVVIKHTNGIIDEAHFKEVNINRLIHRGVISHVCDEFLNSGKIKQFDYQGVAFNLEKLPELAKGAAKEYFGFGLVGNLRKTTIKKSGEENKPTMKVNFIDLKRNIQNWIAEEADNDIRTNDPSGEREEGDGRIIVSNMVIDYDYEVIYNEDKDEFNTEITYNIEEYDIEKLLESKCITFESSNISESIYLTIDEKDYRISTHKRPAVYDENGTYLYDHEYENEIICKNQIEMYHTIESLLKRAKQ